MKRKGSKTMKFLSKINMGKASMIMTILSGILSLIGGVASIVDAKQTAVETARETTQEYLDKCAASAEKTEEEA